MMVNNDLDFETAVDILLETKDRIGIPREKMISGLPVYIIGGRTYRTVQEVACEFHLSANAIASYKNRNGYTGMLETLCAMQEEIKECYVVDGDVNYGKNAPDKIEADIYKGAVSRLEYTRYWQKRYEELEEAMKQIDNYEATRQASYDLQVIGQIYRKDIGEFLQFLSDENGINFQKLLDNGFEELIGYILK